MATGAALIVLRLNASNRKTARTTLDSLERLPVRIVGAVLNDAHSAEQNDYMERYSLDMVDLDAAIPQRTSHIGMIGAGR
jgi:Mrp family chromosome partitioning ATPase